METIDLHYAINNIIAQYLKIKVLDSNSSRDAYSYILSSLAITLSDIIKIVAPDDSTAKELTKIACNMLNASASCAPAKENLN